jgi:hypothetical protein
MPIYSGQSTQQLDEQSKSILTDEEKYNDISSIESILAGLGSGLIQIPKGVFSLGASLIDLGAGTNKAAQVEKYFDDLTELDEKAAATTAGKIAELLVNIGVPGGIGFKVGTSMANAAFKYKKAGKYFSLADDKTGKILVDTTTKLAKLNTKGRVARFGAGAITGGLAEGIFIGDVHKAGTFGDLLGGPTALHVTDPENRDPARDLINRVKFGTEGALFTGLIGGIGKSLKLLAGRNEALRYADNGIDKGLFKFNSWLRKESGATPEFFQAQRQAIGKKYSDINLAQTRARNLNKKIDGLFPLMNRMFDTSTKANRKTLLSLFNDSLISGKPKVLDSGVVKYGDDRIRNIAGKKVKDTGGISKAEKNKVSKFLKDKNIQHKPGQLTGIFDEMENMRAEWADMFSIMGRGIKRGEKKGLFENKTIDAFSKFKEQFGDKFKNYIGATYEAFSNQSIIPMLNYRVPAEIVEKAVKVFRESARLNKTPITEQQAKTYVNNIVKRGVGSKPPKNFDQDALVNLPDFFTNKSLAQRGSAQWFKLAELKGKVGKQGKRELIEEILGKTRNPIQTILAQTGEISAVTRRNELLQAVAFHSVDKLKALRSIKPGTDAAKEAARPLLATAEEFADIAYKKGEVFDPTMYREIKANSLSSGIANPTSGKFALNEVAEAIEIAAGKPVTNLASNAIYRNLILFPKATSQMAKTILSPVTHARNFLSAGAFAVANGIIPGITVGPKELAKAWKNLQVAGLGTRVESEFYRKLARLGVVNTNVRLGDLQGLLKDIDFGSTLMADKSLRGLLKPLSKIKNWTQDAYTAEDDFWKMTTFFGERARYANAYKRAGKKITEDQLDEMAANIVRNNVPNYDYVSSMVKGLRRWPVGNFVSFPAEILRTSTNILQTALREISDPALKRIGWQRLIGMLTVMGAVPYGATKGAQYLYDVSEDELAALRRFVAPWSRNSTLIPIKNEDGSYKYVDFSHANAYDTMIRPWQTALNEVADGQLNNEAIMNNFILGAMKGMGEIAQPFVTESIWTEAMVDVLPILGRGGRTSEGFEIYDKETDTGGDMASKVFIHLLKSQMPGSLKQLGRIDYAMTDFDTPLQVGDLGGPFKWGKIGKYDENGQSYEIMDEGLGIIGMRAVKLNVPRALKFKQAAYASGTRASKRKFIKQAGKAGPIDPNDLVSAFWDANRSLWNVQKIMRDDLVAAKTLNIPNADIFESVKRINRKELGYMLSDSFKPYKPSRDMIATMAMNARKLGLANPFTLASPGIYRILSQLYKLKLSPGSEFPDLLKPLRAVGGDEQTSITPNIPVETSEVSEEVVQTSTLPSNVNQNTGLTRIEEALLSNEEKAMRLRQRGMTA